MTHYFVLFGLIVLGKKNVIVHSVHLQSAHVFIHVIMHLKLLQLGMVDPMLKHTPQLFKKKLH